MAEHGPMEMYWRMLGQSRRLRDITDKRLHPFCAARGLTPQALRTLVTLHFEGEMALGALAKSTCMAGTNSSAMCKRLEAGGLLTRRRAAEDERQVLVSLAPPGEALVADFVAEFAACEELQSVMGAKQEIHNVLESMDTLLAMLDDKGESA